MTYILPRTKKQDGKPFVLSGRSSYYIGYNDMKPAGLGYHIENEMNGLWFPPIRIFKWITLERNGRSMIPEYVTTDYTSVSFGFRELSLKLSTTGDNYFLIELTKEIEIIEPVRIILEIGVIPVWYSQLNTDFSISKLSGSIIISEKNYRQSITASSDGNGVLTYNNNRIVIETKDSTTVNIKIEGNESTNISPANIKKEAENYRHQSVESLRSKTTISGNTSISEAFDLAVINLRWLFLNMNNTGRGVVAGYPEFPWLFGIDTYYSSGGLLIAGMNDEYENTLKVLEKYARKEGGRIPHEIVSNGRVFNMGNRVETVVYPTMVWNLYEYSGNIEHLKEREDLILSYISPAILHDVRGNGIMEDPKAGNGIDIDTVCNYIESMNSILKINSVVHSDKIEVKEIEEEIREKIRFIRKDMWMPEINGFADRYKDGLPQFNGFWTSVLPFSFNLASKENYANFATENSKAFSRLMSSNGLKVDQNGNVMPNGNSMLIKASLNYGDVNNALKVLHMNIDAIGRYSNYCFPEIINNPSGCFIQAWSAALFIENIIYDFLGIYPNGKELEINRRFSIPEEFEGLRINGMKHRNRLYNFEVCDRAVSYSRNII